MNNNNPHIDNLIAKYLAGEITPDEAVQLQAWMESAPDHEKYFGDLRLIHDKATASHTYQRVDTEKAWDALQQKMDEKPKKMLIPDARGKRILKGWAGIAASILVLLGLSGLLFNYLAGRREVVRTAVVVSHDSIVKQTIDTTIQVALNRNSRLRYTATKRNRQAELTGEAYFRVEHSAQAPLLVKAEGTLIEDIGTSFNVKALPGENSVDVSVETGEVRFFTKTNTGIHLKAGETGRYLKASNSFYILESPDLNATAYLTRSFVFRKARLEDVVAKLAGVYAARIELGNPMLADCTLTVAFQNEDIGYILDIIAETLDLTLTHTDTGFVLQGAACNSQ